MTFWNEMIQSIKGFMYSERIWNIGCALIILIFALLLQRIFAKFILALIKKVTNKTKNDIDNNLVEVLEKPAGFIFIILGIYLAGQVTDFSPNAELFIGRIVRSLILFTLFWAAYRASALFAAMFKKHTVRPEYKFDHMLGSFLSNGFKVIIIILGSLTIAQIWFSELGAVITGLGLGGLAFALAAQDSAKNLIGSVTIMIDRPFTIGDWIQTPHVEGIVEEMGFRSTRVRTFAQAVVTIPNSTMSNDAITNWSRMGKRRANYRLGLTYRTTSDQMKECIERLREMLRDHPDVHQDTINVYFERFGDSALNIFLEFFTNTTNGQKYLEIQENINFKIMDILKELGLEVAFPSRSIYLEEIKEEKDKIKDTK